MPKKLTEEQKKADFAEYKNSNECTSITRQRDYKMQARF